MTQPQNTTFIVIPLLVSIDVSSLNLKAGSVIYLLYEPKSGKHALVRWHISTWQCSCNKRGCLHALAVNGHVVKNLGQKTEKSVGQTISYPADWPKARYSYDQTVYDGQQPLTVVGLRRDRYFSFASDAWVQEWIVTVEDRDGNQREVNEWEVGEQPLTVDHLASFSGDEESLP